jgi:ectoine hydroxylase-related dioxygenase (phytanoyl-CoA dioxygenase family)
MTKAECRKEDAWMSQSDRLSADGVILVSAAIGDLWLERLLPVINRATTDVVRRRSGSAYAARNLLRDVSELSEALASCGLNRLASETLGKAAFPVDAISFDKHAEANWGVPGHQDVLMPIVPVGEPDIRHRGRVRDGVTYLEAGDETLASLVALRLHFDDCDPANGALCVAPGSHRSGRLREAEISAIPLEQYVACPASRGDVLLMKPLIVHRSAPAQRPARRRVLHVVYATEQPGEGLRWRDWERPSADT